MLRAILAGVVLLAAGMAVADKGAAPRVVLTDVTAQSGVAFTHDNGSFGKKYLPETLGPGCAFFDYDQDGYQDIVLVNGRSFRAGAKTQSTLKLYRNNRDGTFRDVTVAAGLALPMYGLGAAAGDYDNDGFPDLLITALGQNRLFRNIGGRTFREVTREAGLGPRSSFSTSALWLDYDRDGRLDLFVCNYVKWSPETDVFCSMDGKQKSYCTPEAYRGVTSWLFRNKGGGRFEDVTSKAGVFDTGSKALGATVLDYDRDGWPDLFAANDTQPNKLYRNNRDGTFQETGVRAGVAFSDDGKARAGMGADAIDLDNSGLSTLAVTNFHNEMLGLYRPGKEGVFADAAPGGEIGKITRRTLGFGCFFFDADLDGLADLLVVNGHIDSTVRNTGYRQPPHLFLQRRGGQFEDMAAGAGEAFASPKVGRGAAYADIDRDGDLDVLITTNGGAAHLYRNDRTAGNRSIRFTLAGLSSNRSAIGATLRIFYAGGQSSRTVKSGGSYLSQSELPVTFGLGKNNRIEKVVIQWPSGKVDEGKNLPAGLYLAVEGKGITAE